MAWVFRSRSAHFIDRSILSFDRRELAHTAEVAACPVHGTELGIGMVCDQVATTRYRPETFVHHRDVDV